jgi:hypothetical protein
MSAIMVATITGAILRLEARAEEIKEIIYANPFQELIELRQYARETVAVSGGIALIALTSALMERERFLLNKARQQKRESSDLTLELVEIDMQIDELKKEIYRLTMPELSRKTTPIINMELSK